MPGIGTLFAMGAVGAAGAAAYVNRRNSMTSDVDSPINLARRRSSQVQPDHDYQERKQPEYVWRRDNGVNFSHNSSKKFPSFKE
ncbi:hypothetical protein BDB01DRAFT_411560 [Pilobolus umbonatus]|nr:hypothetical protein BDB01DRAFT_411560 [Pilobolus umbonatus]